jgi:hypothetical protein
MTYLNFQATGHKHFYHPDISDLYTVVESLNENRKLNEMIRSDPFVSTP